MREQERDSPAKPGESRVRLSDLRETRRPATPGLLDRLRSLFGLGGASIRDDIEDALDGTDSSDVFSPQERAMLRNVLGLHEVRIEDIMVPRADIIAVNVAMTLTEVLAVFRDAGHSRLPAHGETLDDPRGMIHIRDFVDVLAGFVTGTDTARPNLSVKVADAEVIRPVLFVPPSMQAIDLLVKMQTSRTHMALVIDEYGGTDGLVSIEDIVEVIVGDIEDEHDEDDEPLVVPEDGGTYLADGRADLEDVSAMLGVELATEDDAEEIDTIGGLVTSIAGRVPHRGEVVTDRDDLEFEVVEADPRRVRRIRIRRREPPTSAETRAAAAPPSAATPVDDKPRSA